MTTMRQARSKTGYLDVKLPAKARGRGLRAWKAWKRRWISLHSLHDLATGGIVITLDIYASANVEGHQLERSTIYLEAVTLLQRTTSRSHPYAFCIEAKQTLVYLAGLCECETQEWMDVVRNVLWPTVMVQEFDSDFGELYSVAVLDATFSSLFGIRGGACNLLISENSVQLCCNHTGHALLEWPHYALARVFLAMTPEQRDRNRIFVIEPRPHFGGWTAPLHLYCSKAQEIVKNVSICMKNGNKAEGAFERKSSLPFTPFLRKHSASKWDSLEKYTDRRRSSCEDVVSVNSEVTCMNVYDTPKMSPVHAASLYQIPPKRLQSESTESYYDQPRCHYTSTNSSYVEEPLATNAPSVLERRRSLSESELNKQHQFEGNLSLSHSLTFQFSELGTNNNQKQCGESSAKVVLRPKASRSTAAPSEALLSICSSVSSRDSGVQMNHSDECANSEKPNDSKTESPIKLEACKNTHYGNVIERVATSTTSSSSSEKRYNENGQCSLSSNSDIEIGFQKKLSDMSDISNDSEIYSEIDVESYSPFLVEPLYEDLDRFRKDVHKLLGIDAKEKLGQCIEKAPPLPPRCPRMGSSQKKDVLRYLGINDPLAREMFQAQQMNKTSPQKGVRRKNLYQYLGVSDSPTDSADSALVRCDSGTLKSVSENEYDVPVACSPKSSSMQKGKDSKTKKFLRRLKTAKETDFKNSMVFSRSYATLPKQLSSRSFHNYHSSIDLETLRSYSSSQRSVSYSPGSRSFTSSDLSIQQMLGRTSSTENPLDEAFLNCEPKTMPVKFTLDEDEEQEITKTSSHSSLNDIVIVLFADRFFHDLWSSVESELAKTFTSELCIEPVDLCQLAEHELGQNVVLHRVYSDDTGEDITCNQAVNDQCQIRIISDPVYLEMTPKVRNFPPHDFITHLPPPNTTHDMDLYQLMHSRSISESSYISLDWELKRKLSLKPEDKSNSDVSTFTESDGVTDIHLSAFQSTSPNHCLSMDKVLSRPIEENQSNLLEDNVDFPMFVEGYAEDNYMNLSDELRMAFRSIPEIVEEEKMTHIEEERETAEAGKNEEITVTQDESVAIINESIEPSIEIRTNALLNWTSEEGSPNGSYELIASCQFGENREILEIDVTVCNKEEAYEAKTPSSQCFVEINCLPSSTSNHNCELFDDRYALGDTLKTTNESISENRSSKPLVMECKDDPLNSITVEGILPHSSNILLESSISDDVTTSLEDGKYLLIDVEPSITSCFSNLEENLDVEATSLIDCYERPLAEPLIPFPRCYNLNCSIESKEDITRFDSPPAVVAEANDVLINDVVETKFGLFNDVALPTEIVTLETIPEHQDETSKDTFPDFATILRQWKRHSFSAGSTNKET